MRCRLFRMVMWVKSSLRIDVAWGGMQRIQKAGVISIEVYKEKPSYSKGMEYLMCQ